MKISEQTEPSFEKHIWYLTLVEINARPYVPLNAFLNLSVLNSVFIVKATMKWKIIRNTLLLYCTRTESLKIQRHNAKASFTNNFPSVWKRRHNKMLKQLWKGNNPEKSDICHGPNNNWKSFILDIFRLSLVCDAITCQVDANKIDQIIHQRMSNKMLYLVCYN